MKQTEDEYISAARLKYAKLVEAEKLATELSARIAEIRAMGYKVIVLGSSVRIT